MEKVMASFEYESLILFLELETSNEEGDKGDTNGARPLGTKIAKQEPRDLRGGKDSLKREVAGKTYTSEHILKQVKFVL